ncbi:hypothetical protein MCOR25_002886 [Pyricularia grisea]|nr:hypothetical protein MCOR25_002886 [Pyricularia grisea]
MKWLSLAIATYVGLVTAHGDHAIPHVVGGRQILAELRARGVLGNHDHHHHHVRRAEAAPVTSPNRQSLATRQDKASNVNGACGPRVGSCADGYCCSPAGWCGKDEAYCASPDCQINYGTGCDGLQRPSGTDTSNIARPHLGKVAYGGLGIYDCVTQGDIALTFDDGPYKYTGDLLDIFKRYQMVATFFVTGNNIGKGMINNRSLPWAGYIERMIAEGHQVASHTWSHQNASELTDDQYTQQIVYNEIALADILGFFPTYMRPPYSICGNNCQSLLSTLGYHVIYFDLDTEGYLHDTPAGAQIGKNIWDQAVGPANPATRSFLQIEHDLQYQSVYNLTEYFLKSIQAKGFRSVPVGVCLGDDPANWYRKVSKDVPTVWPPAGVTVATPTGSTATSSSSASASPSGGLVISTDASCGNGITCQGSSFGNCCSLHGWCGSTADYCGDGCQSAFGTCSNAGNTATTSSSSSSSSASSSSSSSSRSSTSSSAGTVRSSSSSSSSSTTSSQSSTITSSRTSSTSTSSRASSTSSTRTTSTSTSKTTTAAAIPTAIKVTTDGNCGKTLGLTCDRSGFSPCCNNSNKCSWDCISGCQKGYGLCLW